jgi:tRNA dimethylallyltransferase
MNDRGVGAAGPGPLARADIDALPRDRPVLIAGATASGKSALALAIAAAQGRVVVNADALQVWDCWQVLSARPGPDDTARAPHLLYGHRARGQDYSVGCWLREMATILPRHPGAVIVGGTGLYLSALTGGLADIPPTPPEVRARADARLRDEGHRALAAELDPATAARIDLLNPMRVQRAWEVLTATGRGLADWQSGAAPPLVPPDRATRLLVEVPPARLAARIDARFAAMLGGGALDEVRAVLPDWDPAALWARAIGAPELVAYLRGETDLPTAITRAQAATRQYAKRQRTWFRARMGGWLGIAGG